MQYRAALPMYDIDRAKTDRFWEAICAGLPFTPCFERPKDPGALLGDPALVLSQTCWGPIEAGMTPPLQILAQPDYSDLPGGDGPLYRSALVALGPGPDAPPGPLKGTGEDAQAGLLSGLHLAFNDLTSRSGYLAPTEDFSHPARGTATGSHAASLALVAEGGADVAAIDCLTLHLLRHTRARAAVRVIGWTKPRLGLPFVAAPGLSADIHGAMQAALLELDAHAPGPPGAP